MPKLRLIGLTLLALSATAVSHAEETRYVSDELNTWVRSGPGDHYRLVGTVNAGEEVTLLQTDANTNTQFQPFLPRRHQSNSAILASTASI